MKLNASLLCMLLSLATGQMSLVAESPVPATPGLENLVSDKVIADILSTQIGNTTIADAIRTEEDFLQTLEDGKAVVEKELNTHMSTVDAFAKKACEPFTIPYEYWSKYFAKQFFFFGAQQMTDAHWYTQLHDLALDQLTDFIVTNHHTIATWQASADNKEVEQGWFAKKQRYPVSFSDLFKPFASKYASLQALCTNPVLLKNTAISSELALVKEYCFGSIIDLDMPIGTLAAPVYDITGTVLSTSTSPFFKPLTWIAQGLATTYSALNWTDQNMLRAYLPSMLYQRLFMYGGQLCTRGLFLYWYLNYRFLPNLYNYLWDKRTVFFEYVKTCAHARTPEAKTTAKQQLRALLQSCAQSGRPYWFAMKFSNPLHGRYRSYMNWLHQIPCIAALYQFSMHS